MNIFGFLIGLGLIVWGFSYLGINFGWWNRDVINQLLHLWPVVLIIIGLRFLLRQSALFLAAVLVVLGVLAVAWARSPQMFARNPEKNWFTTTTHQRSTISLNQTVGEADTFEARLPGRYNISIAGQESDTVQVNLEGPETVLNSLTLSKNGSHIVLEQKSGFRLMGILREVTGTISVPRSIALNLDLSGASTVKINDHSGNVEFDGSGATHLGFERSTSNDPKVNLSGSGKVSFDSCQGSAQWEMSGAGQIIAEQCILQLLSLESSGGGRVEIKGGTIQDLKVKTSGASHIRIPKPTGTIDEDTSGSASIEYN